MNLRITFSVGRICERVSHVSSYHNSEFDRQYGGTFTVANEYGR